MFASAKSVTYLLPRLYLALVLTRSVAISLCTIAWDSLGYATMGRGGPRYVADVISLAYHKTVPDTTAD